MTNQQSIDHAMMLIREEIKHSAHNMSGYFIGVLARNLAAHQQLKFVLEKKLYVKECKFKHDLMVVCLSPHIFKLIAQSASQLEGHVDITFSGDLNLVDCYVYQNNLGIRWSNKPNDYTSISNSGLPWDEIHANIENTYNEIMEELTDEIREKAQGFC